MGWKFFLYWKKISHSGCRRRPCYKKNIIKDKYDGILTIPFMIHTFDVIYLHQGINGEYVPLKVIPCEIYMLFGLINGVFICHFLKYQ